MIWDHLIENDHEKQNLHGVNQSTNAPIKTILFVNKYILNKKFEFFYMIEIITVLAIQKLLFGYSEYFQKIISASI